MADVTYQIYIDWDNDGSVWAGSFEANEDVSADVLGLRTPLSWSYGRDTARSLSEIQPGQVSLELNNRSRKYSPDNASSALFGNLGPGKQMRIRAVHNSITYELFWGYLDEYTIDPYLSSQSVKLTAIDATAKLAETNVTSELFPSLQIGAAIGEILDLAGWPASKRDLDAGASTARWFWVQGKSAWEAIKELVASEGGPAFAFVDPATGNFVFRDRHHRFLDTASTTSQATFRDTGTEPTFCAPVEYNIGFRDLINHVQFEVSEREPTTEQVVFESPDTMAVASGESVTLHVATEEPFYAAVTPVEDTDYTVVSGNVTVSLTRTSGQSTEIVIAASSTCYLKGMRLRATPVPVARTHVVEAENTTSVTKYGRASWEAGTPPWVNRHDAKAIADVILAQRSERLPVISITVNNGNDTRKVQQLSRKLSDRVTIVETNTGTNHDHFIEQIGHDIGQVGEDHRVQYGCERVRTVSGTQFTFDVAGAGFDQGSFGLSGFDNSTNIFILGSNVSGHRLGSGKLGA